MMEEIKQKGYFQAHYNVGPRLKNLRQAIKITSAPSIAAATTTVAGKMAK